MEVKELITTDPDILSGQPVFAGTRVPVETLFDHLEAGVPLNEFLDDFPTVSREQAVAVLNSAKNPAVRIDTALNKYDNVVLFPEKLAQANAQLKKSGAPQLPKPR